MPAAFLRKCPSFRPRSIKSLTRVALEALAAVDAQEVGLVAGGRVHGQQVLLQRLLALEFLGGDAHFVTHSLIWHSWFNAPVMNIVQQVSLLTIHVIVSWCP